jgi:hypothetical protein
MSGIMYFVKRFLVLLALLALLVPPVATTRIAKARVWVSAQSPLAVRGSGFKAHEHVKVVVSAGRRFVRIVTATDAGSFVTRWTASATGTGTCAVIFVKAAGDRGSTATWRSVANDCANGPTP